MDESRVERLEVQLCFQDDVLDVLNRTVYELRQEMDGLKQQLALLHVRLYQLESPPCSPEAELPPHY